jgi:hypothetical protein
MVPTTFTQALGEAARLATQALPEALHERLDAAIALVKAGHCFQADDGTWTVQSATDPAQTYTHVNGSCPCEDAHFNQPPRGFCKHRLAVYLSRRAAALMTVAQTGAQAPPTPPAVSLPEARASVNVHITIDGRDCLVALRDTDEGRLLARLAVVLAQYPAPQAAPQSGPTLSGQEKEPVCPIHHRAMKASTKRSGQFYCTARTDTGEYCREKG